MGTVEELKNLEAKELYQKIEQAKHDQVIVGVEWAEAEHKYKSLKEMLPSILASIQIELSNGNKPSSVKVEALAHPEYIKKISEMNEAQKRANLKRVEYSALKKNSEALTAVGYLRNSEVKNLRN